MFFAVPDVTIFLAVRAATYAAIDDHQRAVRQQLYAGLFFALALSAIILSTGLIGEPGRGESANVMREPSKGPPQSAISLIAK